MTMLIEPLVVGQGAHCEVLRASATDGKVNAGAATAAKASHPSILQLLNELGAITLSVLQEPANQCTLTGGQCSVNFNVRCSVIHGSNA